MSNNLHAVYYYLQAQIMNKKVECDALPLVRNINKKRHKNKITEAIKYIVPRPRANSVPTDDLRTENMYVYM